MESKTSRALLARLGFTLVELMIVVAIIGCLAAIAIPTFQTMVLRAKRAELPPHIASLKLAEHAYRAEWDMFTACPLTPSIIPGRNPAPFGVKPTDDHPFALLGWVFDGEDGYGQYQVETQDNDRTFTARGQSDIDGDGSFAVYEATDEVQSRLLTGHSVF